MSATNTLLAVLFIVFLLQLLIPGFTELFIFDPTVALQQPWRFITSMFLHASFSHLFFNAYALFLFGNLVERALGSRRFLILYFSSGLAGSILYWITTMTFAPPIPALGASGAIFGILGAAAALFPNMVIYVFFFPMPMWMAGIFWAVVEFLGMFNPYSGIASAAHLGGLVVGYLLAKHWKGGRAYAHYYF